MFGRDQPRGTPTAAHHLGSIRLEPEPVRHLVGCDGFAGEPEVAVLLDPPPVVRHVRQPTRTDSKTALNSACACGSRKVRAPQPIGPNTSAPKTARGATRMANATRPKVIHWTIRATRRVVRGSAGRERLRLRTLEPIQPDTASTSGVATVIPTNAQSTVVALASVLVPVQSHASPAITPSCATARMSLARGETVSVSDTGGASAAEFTALVCRT